MPWSLVWEIARLLHIRGMLIELVSLIYFTKLLRIITLFTLFDNLEIAVIPNSNEVNIYKYEANVSDWTLLDNLNQHGLPITGIDWAPNTNRIVTCSAVMSFEFC